MICIFFLKEEKGRLSVETCEYPAVSQLTCYFFTVLCFKKTEIICNKRKNPEDNRFGVFFTVQITTVLQPSNI